MEVIINTISQFLDMIEYVIFKVINVLSNTDFFGLNIMQYIIIFTIAFNIMNFVLYMVGDRQ